MTDYREELEALESRYGVVMAAAIREEIRKADNGGVVHFTACRDLAVQHAIEEAAFAAEDFKVAA
jgi:hypothetical protein